MPDSVLIPAPVNALMTRADRAISISAATAGSWSLDDAVSGLSFNARIPSPGWVDHAWRSQLVLCPYGPDGTMRSLARTRIPAQLSRRGAYPAPARSQPAAYRRRVGTADESRSPHDDLPTSDDVPHRDLATPDWQVDSRRGACHRATAARVGVGTDPNRSRRRDGVAPGGHGRGRGRESRNRLAKPGTGAPHSA